MTGGNKHRTKSPLDFVQEMVQVNWRLHTLYADSPRSLTGGKLADAKQLLQNVQLQNVLARYARRRQTNLAYASG